MDRCNYRDLVVSALIREQRQGRDTRIFRQQMLLNKSYKLLQINYIFSKKPIVFLLIFFSPFIFLLGKDFGKPILWKGINLEKSIKMELLAEFETKSWLLKPKTPQYLRPLLMTFLPPFRRPQKNSIRNKHLFSIYKNEITLYNTQNLDQFKDRKYLEIQLFVRNPGREHFTLIPQSGMKEIKGRVIAFSLWFKGDGSKSSLSALFSLTKTSKKIPVKIASFKNKYWNRYEISIPRALQKKSSIFPNQYCLIFHGFQIKTNRYLKNFQNRFALNNLFILTNQDDYPGSEIKDDF